MKKLFTILFVFGLVPAFAQLAAPRGEVFTTSNPSTNNVGVGTETPAYRLDVEGAGTRIKNSSTADNAYTTFRIQGPDYVHGLEIDFFGNNNLSNPLNWSYGGGAGSAAVVNVNAKPLILGTNNLARIFIEGNGNVAIGTTDAKGYKLAVAGKVISEETVVKLQANWPDYVFESDYKLKPLTEVEAYVKENKHLPEVPSEKEIKENGHKLGEMDVLLLKKVEELTLYIIELKKENEMQRKQNMIQQAEIESIKNKLK